MYGAGRQPEGLSCPDLVAPEPIGDIQAEEIGLLGFQLLLLANLADSIVRKLLESLGTHFSCETEALSDVMQFLGNRSEDLLATADGVLEHTNTPEATLVNVSIHRAGRDDIDDGHRLALLAIAVD